MTLDYGEKIRSAPQAVEAEEAVIGCVLINPDSFYDVSSFLEAKDFYLHKHRWIWQAVVNLEGRGMPVDIITLAEELSSLNQLAESGGTPYLVKLINDVPTSLHAEAYGRLVQRESVARDTIAVATNIAKLAYTENLSALDMVSQTQKLVLDLSISLSGQNELQSVGEIAEAYYERLRKLVADPSSFVGVYTHLADLDRLLGGFREPDLITVAGRPGTGKSSLMLTAGFNAAVKEGKRVLLFSMEMGKFQVTERLISMISGVPVEVLHRGAVVEGEWAAIEDAKDKLKDIHIIVDDTTMLTPSRLKARATKEQLKDGLDLVIVDYLQLMVGDGKYSENRVQEVSAISRGLKNLAGDLHVPVLAGSQLSRAIEQRQDKRPVLSDLRESGSIEQDSDIVIFLASLKDNPNIITVPVAKNRNGSVGDVDLFFKKDTVSFHNAASNEITL